MSISFNYIEETLRRINRQQVHQLLRLDIIVLNQSLYAITVFLRTNMLMRREIRHNVKALLFTEYPLKYWVCKVQRIATEFVRHIQSIRRTHIAHQLRQPVLIQINHHYRCRLKPQYRLFHSLF